MKTITEGTRLLWRESAHHRLRRFFAESFDEPGSKGAFEMRHLFLLFIFVGTHFRVFVRKFSVHLRAVYASPQKLARPLIYACAWACVVRVDHRDATRPRRFNSFRFAPQEKVKGNVQPALRKRFPNVPKPDVLHAPSGSLRRRVHVVPGGPDQVPPQLHVLPEKESAPARDRPGYQMSFWEVVSCCFRVRVEIFSDSGAGCGMIYFRFLGMFSDQSWFLGTECYITNRQKYIWIRPLCNSAVLHSISFEKESAPIRARPGYQMSFWEVVSCRFLVRGKLSDSGSGYGMINFIRFLRMFPDFGAGYGTVISAKWPLLFPEMAVWFCSWIQDDSPLFGISLIPKSEKHFQEK